MPSSTGAPQRAMPPPPATDRRAAFFGLDTLIPGSSLYLLARGLQHRRFYGRADIVGFAWNRLVARAAPTRRQPVRASQDAALEFVTGRHRPELQALAREIADERILPLVYPDLAQLIDAHRAEGMLTFVATAAPAELAEIVASGLGMDGGLGTAAEVDDDERFSGRLTGAVLQGPAKARAVQDHAAHTGIDLSASVAYSDSVNDLPLLELVGRPEVVNPDRQLRRIARNRRWPVHDVAPAPPRAGAVPVPSRLAALELASQVEATGPPVRRGSTHHFTTANPAGLVRELEESGRFRRDTRLGAILHRGQISLREVAPTHSLHITVGKGNAVSAHVDRYSPLAANQPEELTRYALHRVAAHNVADVVARVIPGRRRRRAACDRRPQGSQ